MSKLVQQLSESINKKIPCQWNLYLYSLPFKNSHPDRWIFATFLEVWSFPLLWICVSAVRKQRRMASKLPHWALSAGLASDPLRTRTDLGIRSAQWGRGGKVPSHFSVSSPCTDLLCGKCVDASR
jgi:hypothetical protein